MAMKYRGRGGVGKKEEGGGRTTLECMAWLLLESAAPASSDIALSRADGTLTLVAVLYDKEYIELWVGPCVLRDGLSEKLRNSCPSCASRDTASVPHFIHAICPARLSVANFIGSVFPHLAFLHRYIFDSSTATDN